MSFGTNHTSPPDDKTTTWNSSKYSSMGEAGSGSASSTGFNYSNIKLPTIDVHPPSSSSDKTKTYESFDTKNSGRKYIDAGLNQWETRVDKPPITPQGKVGPANPADGGSSGPTKPDLDTKLPKSNIPSRWDAFRKEKSIKSFKRFIGAIVENIPEMFFIPDMIATSIVNGATEKSKRNGISYAENKLKIRSHFKLFIGIILTLYITLNWWYLMLYTNHYIDFYQIIKTPVFFPIIWIIGPLCIPIAQLNYYVLGKRTEPEFYAKYIEPILKNKAIYLSILFILIMLIYEPMMSWFAATMKDILGESSGTNPLVAIVMIVVILSFLQSVVFNTERNIQFINTVGILVAVVAYLIMFILVLILAKPVSMFVIFYVLFYSFLFLFLSGGFLKIFEMMSDTTELCIDNSSTSIFSKIKNMIHRYSFFIIVFLVITIQISIAMHDVSTIKEERVRATCYAIYSVLLFVFILLIGRNFSSKNTDVKQMVLGETGESIETNNVGNGIDDPINKTIFDDIASPFYLVLRQIYFLGLTIWESIKYGGYNIKTGFWGLVQKFSGTIETTTNGNGSDSIIHDPNISVTKGYAPSEVMNGELASGVDE